MRRVEQHRMWGALSLIPVIAWLGVACGDGDDQGMTADGLIILTTDDPLLETFENGSVVEFEAVLGDRPVADVKVPLRTSDESEGVVFQLSLTFTPDNWSEPQIVTVAGQNDELVDGPQAYQLLLGPTMSMDERYDGLEVASMEIINQDDDVPGITVREPTGSTSEIGTEVTFDMVLDTGPTADVVISFSSTDPSEGVPEVTSVTFSPSNWSTPQSVAVVGVDDSEQDGDQTYSIAFQSITSADAAYAAVPLPASFSLINEDDDTPGITVSATGNTTTESGGAATFSVRLESRPTGAVHVNFNSNDLTEGTVDRTTLTFTSSTWSVPQVVNVVGVDDQISDGSQTYSVVFTAQTGDDPTYNAFPPPNPLVFTNTDDDITAIEVTSLSRVTTEFGMTATVSIVLTTPPNGEVIVNLDTDTPTEGIVSRTSVTFTSADWSIPQKVIVTGVDDALTDGPQTYAVAFGPTTGDDATYRNLPLPAALTFTNYDDESPFLLRSEHIDAGVATYMGHASFGNGVPAYRTVIARLNEPSMMPDDFRWFIVPGLTDESDVSLVSLVPVSFEERYLRIDSAMPGRWPICGEGGTYGWSACIWDFEAPAARRNLGWIDTFVDTPTFRSDATFRLVPALDGLRENISLQWYGDASIHLRHASFHIIAEVANTLAFQQRSSFTLEQ